MTLIQYAIVNRINYQLFPAANEIEALEIAIRENRSSAEHPSFFLYQFGNADPIAELHRDPGRHNLYWKFIS